MSPNEAPDPAKPAADAGYSADSIQVLEGLEAVRKRPGMYIGDTGPRGMHHLVYEIVDNAIDEALAGYCKNITVRLLPDNGVVVVDDGRGIPVDVNKQHGLSGITLAFTKLHAGGKFQKGAYKVSGGLHGVGASVVNALSEECEVEVHQKGHVHVQAYVRGVPKGPVERRERTDRTGTRVFFRPDRQMFGDIVYEANILATRLRELAFLNRGISIRFVDERAEPLRDELFRFEGGLTEFVQRLNQGATPLHDDVIACEREQDGVTVEVAAQFHDGYSENVQGFVNNIHTTEGGTHVTGFRNALSRAMLAYARAGNFFKEDDKPSGEDFREGLTAVISVKVPEPQFEGQTKTKLGNGEVEGIVFSVWHDALKGYLEENPRQARAIVEKAVQAFQAREAARKARDLVRRKGPFGSGGLPGKLSDCSSRDVERTELFLVEGESAGGSAKQGRDRETQAILPLRGKILNVEKARVDKMLAHEEIRALVTALGTGIGAEEFDPTKCRYGKIVIMTDADVDGSHIRTLLLTFLFRHMRPLVEQGRVFVAQPPLFKLTRARSKAEEYIFDEKVLQARLQALGAQGISLARVSGGGQPISGARMERLLQHLGRLEGLARALERRGLPVGAALAAARGGQLPTAAVLLSRKGGGHVFVHGDAELAQVLASEEALAGRPLKTAEAGDPGEARRAADAVIERIYESGEMAAVAKALAEDGLDAAQWDPPEGSPAVFRVVREGQPGVDLPGLKAVLRHVREAGQEGVDLQRYKGLGEMNHDQLWTTTMDPAKRTLLRVQMSDEAEASRLFALLMGETVEPRRDFIERHALDVTALDV